MHTNRAPNPIGIFIFGFAGGIFISSFVFISPLVALLIIILGFTLLVDRKREVVILSLVLVSFGLGSVRYAIKDFHILQTPSSMGVVVREPEDKENTRRFVFEADNGEKALVSAPLYTDVAYGDRIEVKGSFKQPGIIESENGGRDFDYGAYLSKDDIYWTTSFAEVTVLEHDKGNPIRSALFRIKNSFISHAQKMLPEPQASLLMGLVIAGRDALPAGIPQEFRRAGVVHIVVLSGFNVTLIAEFMRRMFQKLFLWMKFTRLPQASGLAALLGVALFTLMTGASATVVRAAVMAAVAILGRFVGRSYSAPRALYFAGFLMLVENPKILVFDPSFQLSFLATLGLIYFMPFFEKKLHKVTERFQLRETLAQTLATQLTVLPLLVYSVGDVSIVSLPANILILLTVPWTMLVGFIAVILSYISSVLAWPIAFISHILLSYILFVAHALGSLPFATIKTPPLSFWAVFLFYGMLGVGITWRRGRAVPQRVPS